MNPAAILALIGDLYQQIATLSEENKALREAAQPPQANPVS
jgi:hypothetical protein